MRRFVIPTSLVLVVLFLSACQQLEVQTISPIATVFPITVPTLTPIVRVVEVTSSPDPATGTPIVTATATPPFRALPNGDIVTYATPAQLPVTPIPPAAAFIPSPEGVTTVLLLGSDQRAGRRGNATDTIIIVAIHREANVVNMISIPRDTYVYVPGWTMERVNSAFVRGEVLGYPGGGIAMLRETLLYNFGVAVDHFARVDIDGFARIVDIAGGVDVSVDCTLTDWRLISPELDINNPDNWEQFTLAVGVHHMNGDLALWYARSRQSTSDFDRNRRQQQLLRALAQQSPHIELIPRLPSLWDEVSEIVATDMQFADALELAPLALNLSESRVHTRSVAEVLSGWKTPDTGAAVQLPDLEKVPRLIEWLYVEPTVYAVFNEGSRIEVINGTANAGWDVVAAERLAWDGLNATASGQNAGLNQERTQIIDFTGRVKGTSAALLARVLSVPDQDIVVEPDPSRAVDFQVVLGHNYDSCTYR